MGEGKSNKGEVGKTSYFLHLCLIISKTVRDASKGSCICALDWDQGR